MMNLDDLRREVDSLALRLTEKDPFWQKCYPCKNGGACCQHDSPLALQKELEQIAHTLDRHPSIKRTVASNISQNRHCIFYAESASSCLIHELRPLMCRLTPIKAMPDNTDIVVYDGVPNIFCASFLKHSPKVLSYDPPFILTPRNVYLSFKEVCAMYGLNYATGASMPAHKYFFRHLDLHG